MACDYEEISHKPMLPMQYLYRNKPTDYFKKIATNGHVMKKYIKDNSGDPKSPINGKLNGLFFMANVDKCTLSPPLPSPFGNTRLCIPYAKLLKRCNLYFTDFYCMRRSAHYITLVATKQGSASDKFCRKRLPRFDPYEPNRFFFILDEHLAMVSQRTWVEVFYTEDINLMRMISRGAHLTAVISTGTSTPGGVPKDTHCTHCNIDAELEHTLRTFRELSIAPQRV